MKKVFITGATGNIASYVIPQLIDAGISVNALVKDKTKADGLKKRDKDQCLCPLFWIKICAQETSAPSKACDNTSSKNCWKLRGLCPVICCT